MFLAAALALCGLPLSGVFRSEFQIVVGGFAQPAVRRRGDPAGVRQRRVLRGHLAHRPHGPRPAAGSGRRVGIAAPPATRGAQRLDGRRDARLPVRRGRARRAPPGDLVGAACTTPAQRLAVPADERRPPTAPSSRSYLPRAARRGRRAGAAARAATAREPLGVRRRRPGAAEPRARASSRCSWPTHPSRSLVGAFALRGELVVLRAPADDDRDRRIGSHRRWWPAARWAEQELARRHARAPAGVEPGGV